MTKHIEGMVNILSSMMIFNNLYNGAGLKSLLVCEMISPVEVAPHK
jgi:hypothetical protein